MHLTQELIETWFFSKLIFNCKLIEKITREVRKILQTEDSLHCCLQISFGMLTCLVRRDKIILLCKIEKYRDSLQRFFPTYCVSNAESKFGAYRPGFEFWFCYLLAVWTWASYLVSLSLSHLVCWLVMMIPLLRIVMMVKWANYHYSTFPLN